MPHAAATHMDRADRAGMKNGGTAASNTAGAPCRADERWRCPLVLSRFHHAQTGRALGRVSAARPSPAEGGCRLPESSVVGAGILLTAPVDEGRDADGQGPPRQTNTLAMQDGARPVSEVGSPTSADKLGHVAR